MALPVIMFSQTLEDAVRYSKSTYFSTARTMGVGGSFGSMGADFGAISINPATLGNYWRGEFNLSFGLYNGKTKAGSEAKSSLNLENRFSFDNIGFVSNSTRKTGKDSWRSINFALGLNKSSNFYSDFRNNASNPGSIIEDTRLVSGVDYGPWEDIPINKSLNIYESGSINELLFALGGNVNRKFMYGFSVGIPFLNYSTQREYREEAPDELKNDDEFYFVSNVYNEDYSTVGVGINFKGGVIFQLPQKFRLGISLHTPTYFSLKDQYDIQFNVESNNYTFDPLNNSGYFNYKFKTPWRFLVSGGKLYRAGNLKGFVNLDVEYVGYNSARYNFRYKSDDPYDYENEKIQNEKIREQLKSGLNIRLGSEMAIKKIRFRAGLGLTDTPFSEGGYQADLLYSLGFGYRANSFFVDFAYLGYTDSYTFFPYIADKSDRSPTFDINKHFNKFTFTTGFKF